MQIQNVSPENKWCSTVEILDQITENLEGIVEENIVESFSSTKVITSIELMKFIENQLSDFFQCRDSLLGTQVQRQTSGAALNKGQLRSSTSLLKSILEPYLTSRSKKDTPGGQGTAPPPSKMLKAIKNSIAQLKNATEISYKKQMEMDPINWSNLFASLSASQVKLLQLKEDLLEFDIYLRYLIADFQRERLIEPEAMVLGAS